MRLETVNIRYDRRLLWAVMSETVCEASKTFAPYPKVTFLQSMIRISPFLNLKNKRSKVFPKAAWVVVLISVSIALSLAIVDFFLDFYATCRSRSCDRLRGVR